MGMTLRTDGACDLDPAHLLEVFGEQRRRFVEVLQGFGPQDWAAPTRCAEWSVHDVVRHLCDVTPLIAAETGDHTVDPAAGFDPRVTPRLWLAESAGEPPDATLRRLQNRTEEGLGRARERLDSGRRFSVRMPYGAADWTILALHILWDSWVHERDVLLGRGAPPAIDDDATGYAVAYGLFIATAVASQFADRICGQLTLSGDGGGTFAFDNGCCGSTVSVTRTAVSGPPAAEAADALAGRMPVDAVLKDLPRTTRTAVARLANFFNTPVRRGGASGQLAGRHHG